MHDKSYTWKPIDLWRSGWISDGLEGIFATFREHAGEEIYRKFLGQVVREWSISTGEIEGAYHIGRGATETMIESGLVQNLIPKQRNGLSEEVVFAVLKDHEDTLEGLFEFVKMDRPLAVSDIRQLHQQLMRNVDEYEVFYTDPVTHERVVTRRTLEKGKFKETPNSPSGKDGRVHEYCPPLEVEREMERLVELFGELDANCEVADVKAAWLHHAFTQIHPFQDGNGRVARVLASLVLIKARLPAFTVIGEMKDRYILALEAADRGSWRPLLDVFESGLYRQAVRLWHELKVSPESPVGQTPSLAEILSAANGKLVAKYDLLPTGWNRTDDLIQTYKKLTGLKLDTVSEEITASLRKVNQNFHALHGHTRFQSEVASIARLEDWGEGFSKVEVDIEMLSIKTDVEDKIVVGFDSFSSRRKGLAGAFVALKKEERFERIGKTFFFHFESTKDEGGFDVWLKGNLVEALRIWQERLG